MSIKNIIDGTYKLEGVTITPSVIDIGTKYLNFNDVEGDTTIERFNNAINYCIQGYKVQFPRQATYYIEGNTTLFINNVSSTILDIDFNECVLIFDSDNTVSLPISITSGYDLTIRNLKIINNKINSLVNVKAAGRLTFENCKFIGKTSGANTWLFKWIYTGNKQIYWNNCSFDCTQYGISLRPSNENDYFYFNDCRILAGGAGISSYVVEGYSNTYFKNLTIEYKEGSIPNQSPALYIYSFNCVINNLIIKYPASDTVKLSHIRLCCDFQDKECSYSIINSNIPRTRILLTPLISSAPTSTANCIVNTDIYNCNFYEISTTHYNSSALVECIINVHDCIINVNFNANDIASQDNIGKTIIKLNNNIFKNNFNVINNSSVAIPYIIENNIFCGAFTFTSKFLAKLKLLNNIFRNISAISTDNAVTLEIKYNSGIVCSNYPDNIIVEGNIIEGIARDFCLLKYLTGNEFENSTIIMKNNKNCLHVLVLNGPLTPSAAGQVSYVTLIDNNTSYDLDSLTSGNIFTYGPGGASAAVSAKVISNTNIPHNLNQHPISQNTNM